MEYIYTKEDPADSVPTSVVKSSNQTGGFNFRYKGGMTATEESTIMLVLLHGLFINTAKMVGFNKYKNCFPFDKSVASVARDSLLTVDRSGPKYILYMELANILGRQKYNLTTKIPEVTLRKLDDRQKAMIVQCFRKDVSESKRTNKSPKKQKKRSFRKSPRKSPKRPKKRGSFTRRR